MAIWRVTAAGTLYGTERWANVFHVDAAPAFNHLAVLDAFQTCYSQNAPNGGMSFLNPCPGTTGEGPTGVVMTSLTLQAVQNPTVPEIRQVSHQGGQNAPGGLPIDVSLVVSWRTSLAGRSFRGRTYLPPWHENQNTDAEGTFPAPLGATVTAITKNASRLLTDLLNANAPLVVYSRQLGRGTTVTGGYIDTNWDTQRRRSKSVPASRVLFAGP